MSNIPANQPQATAASHWGTRESTEKRQQAANEIVRNILKREAIEDLNKYLHIHFLITLLLVCCYCVLSGSYTFIPALDLHDNTQNILYIVVNILRPLIGIFILIFQYYNLKWPLVYWTLFFISIILFIYLIIIYIYRFAQIAGSEWTQSQDFKFFTRLKADNIDNIDMLVHAMFYSVSILIFVISYAQIMPRVKYSHEFYFLLLFLFLFLAFSGYYIYKLSQ